MKKGDFDFIEISFEFPPFSPIPKNEDIWRISALTAKEMGLKPAIFVLQTPPSPQKKETIDGIDVFRFGSTVSMLYQLAKARPKLVNGYGFGWIPAMLAPLLTKRYVLSPFVYDLANYKRKYGWRTTACLELIKKSDAIITLTEYEASQFDHVMDNSKIHVIPCPVDYDHFSQVEEGEKEEICNRYNFSSEDKIILSVAVQTPRKNLETLIRSFAIVKSEFPSSKLILVGSEPLITFGITVPNKQKYSYRSKLIDLATSLGIEDDVIFARPPDERELRKFHATGHVFCLPSLAEAQLLAAGEAASAGLPLVLSNLEPLQEIYQGCALFHEPMDYQGLATHIINIFNNSKLAENLGNTGRSRMRNYHHSIIKAKLKELYESLLYT